MDKKLVELYRNGKQEQLQELLSNKRSEVLQSVDSWLLRGKGDPTEFIKAILTGWPCGDGDSVNNRVALYRHCITLLQRRELSTKQATDLTAVLVIHVDDLPGQALVDLCSVYLDLVKSGDLGNTRSLELLARVLTCLPQKTSVDTGSVGEMTGSQYKSHVLNSICSSRWENNCVIPLASMFRDVTMTTEEHRLVITKLLRMMSSLPLQELPPLVYQLLLLSSKGLKKQTLEGISQFFTRQDCEYRKRQNELLISDDDLCESSSGSDNLYHVEGTVILHVTTATRQDQDLARELIKLVKAGNQGQSTLTSFTLALALSISRIHRFHDQVFELLKSCIVKSYRDNEHFTDSGWVREMVTKEEDVGCHVIDTVKNSVVGWDHVTQGMVELGFILMEGYSPRSHTPSDMSPAHKAALLGKDLLIQSFKSHKMVREEIIDQALNHIITKASSSVNHYIDLFSTVVRSHPQIVLDSVPRIRESLDYLALLPLATAEGLLRALQPLLRISMSLRDTIILTLRKSLFSRQLESRQVAVTGFLLLLRQLRVVGGVSSSQASQASFTCSQVAVDIHVAGGSGSGSGWTGLCLEVLGNLRRCLTQQAHIRLLLYQGLFEVATRNTQLLSPILHLLADHFESYYESSEDVLPPINLSSCIVADDDKMVVTEPLAHLLQCVIACLNRTNLDDDADTEAEEACNRWQQLLSSLSNRMMTSQLSDFELDKSGDFSPASSVGSKNCITAMLAAGVSEVLMEHKLMSSNYTKSSVEDALELFKHYQQYSGLLKEKTASGPGGTKRGRPGPSATRSNDVTAGSYRSLMSVNTMSQLTHALYEDELPDHHEGLSDLRGNVDFQLYLMLAANQKLSQVKQTGECDGPDGKSRDRVIKYLVTITRGILRAYIKTSSQSERRERTRSLSLACLDVYTNAVSVFTSVFSDKLSQFLSSLEEDVDEDLQLLLHKHVSRCQRLVMDVVGDEDRSSREAVHLLTSLTDLVRHMTAGSEAHNQLTSWSHRLCTEHDLDDTAVVKSAVNLLLDVTAQSRSNVTLLRDLSRDIHGKMGDINQEVEVDDESVFSVVTIHTAVPTVLLLVLRHTERQLHHTDWVITAMQNTQKQHGEDGSLTQKEDSEKSVCTRLGHLTNMFHELTQTALPTGPAMESLLRSLIHLFTSLTALTKYYIHMYQTGTGHLSSRFEKLMKLCGSNLSPYVYALVNYIQAKQSETIQNQAEKGKKKKGEARKADSNKDKTRVLRETKSIPGLIFSMEQFERYLIQLTKKSKVSLMQYFKMSTSRDFRINAQSLQQALDEVENEAASSDEAENTDQEDEHNGSSDNNQENEEPSEKRAKTHPNINISQTANPPRVKPTFRRLSKANKTASS